MSAFWARDNRYQSIIIVEKDDHRPTPGHVDHIVETHHGYEASIELVRRDFGDQEATTWLPFSSIATDSHHDQIIVTVSGIRSRYPAHLTHMIDAPWHFKSTMQREESRRQS